MRFTLRDPRALAVGMLAALTSLISVGILPRPWDVIASVAAAGIAGAVNWHPTSPPPSAGAPPAA